MGKAPSDYNDLKNKAGLAVVRKQVEAAIDAEKGIPFGPYLVKPNGVYLVKISKDGDEEQFFFCSYLKPVGLARSVKGENFALAMEMKDPDGRLKPFVLSLESLHRAGGEEAKLTFSRLGGYFGTGIRTRQAFSDFCNAVMARAANLPRIILASQCGWLRLSGVSPFVLPDGTVVGASGVEKVILQHPDIGGPECAVKGTLADWQEKVGRFCVGNSRLLLAASTVFAGPLLELMNRESGGLHLVGISSLGKSTVLNVAGSCMGEPRSTIRTMNSTASAFENQASLANDTCLLLDELGEAPPEQLGAVIYKLSNGQGRGRADQSGNAKERRTWRLLFVTTGETDLEAMMKQAGKKTFAGQMLRHANIPADTGCHGIFEELHGLATGAALSEYLRRSTMECYGSPLRAYLDKLVDERNRQLIQLQERLHGILERFKVQAVPRGADGQVSRVASRFALIAAAGELATEYGATGWPVGAAFDGALTCFAAWLERRGTIGKAETEMLLEQVAAFFDAHGESRFTPMEGEIKGPARPVINRAGFRRLAKSVPSEHTAMEYFVLASAFKEMVAGFEPKWAARVLADKGLLRTGSNNKTSVTMNLPTMGKARCYHFPAQFADDEPAESAEAAGMPF
jgi:putative DNA primase/helicase